jgi:hypothetical protein
MTRNLLSPWLADIAANVLVVTLIVLIGLSRLVTADAMPAPATSLTIQPVTPVGGQAAVEILRKRLLLEPGLADIVPDTGDLPDTVATLFILDPARYPPIAADMARRGQGWAELTVPSALKTGDNRWHPDFLALSAVADDPAHFRDRLQDLLIERGKALGTSGATGTSLSSRAGLWLAAALQTLGLLVVLAAVWGLMRLRRWSLTV